MLGADQDGDADFAGCDQLDVDAGFGEGAEHQRGVAGRGLHAGADQADLDQVVVAQQRLRAQLVGQRGGRFVGLLEIAARHREGQVGESLLAGVLHDRVDRNAGVGERAEELGGDARAIGHVAQRERGDIAVEGDGSDTVFRFHLDLLANDGAGRVVGGEGRGDDDGDVVEQPQFHGAGVHYRRALRGGFEHLFGGDVGQPPRVGLDARIGGVDAVHIGVNLDLLRVQRRAQRDRRGVGAAAAQGGEIGRAACALEAGDDHDVARGELALDPLGVDIADAGAAKRVVGEHAGLRAGQRDRAAAPFPHLLAHGHGQQGAADHLARREQHVHFPARRAGADRLRQGDQIVGRFAHRGDHHRHRLACRGALRDPLGDRLQALDRADAGAAVLLHHSHRTVAPDRSISVTKPVPSMPRSAAAAANAACVACAALASVSAISVEPPPDR